MATGGNLSVSELDFFEIKENLKNYLSNQSVFKDYDFDGSALSVLLDVLAYNTHYQAFYANMVANEMFLDSAVTRNAVVSRAKELGYTPNSTKAAQAELQVTFNGPVGQAGYSFFPIGTLFKATNENGISKTFVNTDVVTLSATGGSGGNTGGTFNVYEGDLRTVSFIYDANRTDQKFMIPSSGVDTNELKVRIQNSPTDSTGYYAPWTLQSNYAGLTSGTNSYFLQEIEDGRYEIYFGDGLIGKKPTHGNVITVQYLETSGPEGNNFGKNDVKSGRRSFSYSSDTTIDVLSYSQGGGNPESLNSIKYYAPRSFQAQDRAVTSEDYKTLVSTKYGDAESVFVYGGEDSIPPKYGSVFISIKPNAGTSLSDFEKETIKKSILEDRNIVSIIPEIIDPDYIYLIINSDVILDQSKTSIEAKSMEVLLKQRILTYISNRLEKFSKNFRFSKFVSHIDNFDDSILSNRTNITMQKRLEPAIGNIAGYVMNFYNKIYHPHDGHAGKIAAVKSSMFKYKNKDNMTVDAYIEDDGYGVLCLYTNIGGEKIKIQNIGSVDYGTGSLSLVSFNPVQDESSFVIKFNVIPDSLDINSSRNILITLDSSDSDALSVNVIKETEEVSIGTTNTAVAVSIPTQSTTSSSSSSSTSSSSSSTSSSTPSTPSTPNGGDSSGGDSSGGGGGY